MNATPQIVPVSDLRNDSNRILELSKSAPVFLTKNGHAAGVLVSTYAWDRIFERIEELEDLVAVLDAELAVERGEEIPAPVTEEELRAMVVQDEVPA